MAVRTVVIKANSVIAGGLVAVIWFAIVLTLKTGIVTLCDYLT